MQRNSPALCAPCALLLAFALSLSGCQNGENPADHVHTKDSKGQTVSPTCAERGYTLYTCQCGENFHDDFVEPTGNHRMTDWYTVSEPFCYANGEARRTCYDCGFVETRVIPTEEEGHDSAELVVEDFPLLPYKIYKTYSGRYFTEDILATRIENFTEYYVDTVTGNDANAGTSRTAPVKTLKRALYLAENKAFCITIINEGAVLFADGLPGSTAYMLKHNGIIRAEHKATLVGGIENPGFTKVPNLSNVYSSSSLPKGQIQSSIGVSAVVDMDPRNVDEMGLYRAMKPVSSMLEVEITDGSYYYDNTDNIMYVNPLYEIDTVHPLLASYQLAFNLQNAQQDTMLYMENLNVVGGLYFDGHSKTSGQGDAKLEFVAKRSTFQHNHLTHNLRVYNFNASYMIDCVAGYSLEDGYNYHAFNLSHENRVSAMHVEVNCRAAECGFYRLNFKVGEVNNNLSSAHEGVNVLRVNFSGRSSYGPLIADVNGCHSVCIDCTVYTDYEYAEGSHDDFQFSASSNPTRRGKAVLINCYAYDTRRDAVRLRASVEYLTVQGGNVLLGNVKNTCDVTNQMAPCKHSYRLCGKMEHLPDKIYQVYHCIHCMDTYLDDRFLGE